MPVYVREDLRELFSPPRRSCEERAGHLKCQEISGNQFSPLWRCCEARACLFMCVKYLR